MTVKELIEALGKIDQDLPVVVYVQSYDGEDEELVDSLSIEPSYYYPNQLVLTLRSVQHRTIDPPGAER